MKAHVVVLDPGYDSYDQEIETLSRSGFSLSVCRCDRQDSAGKIEFARQADGLLIRWTKVDDEFLTSLPNIKAIVRYGVGYDNVDLDACTRHGVLASNVKGYANQSVSDHALALIFACARSLKEGMRIMRSNFGSPPREHNIDLHDKTLGIIGLGNIGSTLARKSTTLFESTLAFDPYIAEDDFAECGAQKETLETLLRQSDVISLNCNLTEETRSILNRDAFLLMDKRPIIVNTARGEVIDPAALYEALISDRIHSVGADVFPDEPPGEDWDALLDHPYVIATGHYAWHSVHASRELQRQAGENIAALLRGEIPKDCLNG